MPVQLYKLEISLTDCHTVVSRTIIVPAEITLDALHVVIQRTMGWRNSWMTPSLKYTLHAPFEHNTR